MKRALGITLLTASFPFLLTRPAVATTLSTETLQERIDAASPGEAVTVPEGRYTGTIVLRNGVSLVGPEDGEAVIDGAGAKTVVEGAPDAILSALTISGGKEGINTRGAFIGIFDCTIRSCESIAVHVGGGSAVIVNNIIEGGSITCNSSNPLLICNTIVTTGTDGLWSWYGPGPTALNNLVVGADHGVHASAGSLPSLDSNAFWACGASFSGCEADTHAINADPLFVDAEGGDLRLAASSPLLGRGRAVPGLWNGEMPDVGWNAGRVCSIEECRAFLDLVAPTLVPDFPLVVYTLGEETGEFLVTTSHAAPVFSVGSSTPQTEITGIEAFKEEDEAYLSATLIDGEYPRVDVRGEEPDDATAENRYVLRHTYHRPDSYCEDGEGRRVFRRTTDFPRVVVEVPDGFRVARAARNGIPLDEDLPGAVEISSPGKKEVEVVLERTGPPPLTEPD